MRQTKTFISAALAIMIGASGSAQGPTGPPPAGPQRRGPREAFLRLIDRPRVPLAPEVETLPGAPSVVREHFAFSAQEGERVPGVLLKPRTGSSRRPVVILLHGTGGSKSDTQIVKLSEALVARGFIAVAIDGRYHGERARPGARSTEYVAAILQAYRTPGAHPFLYDTVWDVMRLIDYLETRQDVDAARIGVTGISKGGMETYLAAAVDPRIAVAVPVIGVQSFRWALDHDSWQSRVGTFQAAVDAAATDAGVKAVDAAFVRRFYDRLVPGICAEFDAPAMLPLVAPRPLLAINGDSDARTPLEGVRESAAAAERAYRAAGVPDRFVLHIQPHTGHAFGEPAQQAALDWFVRWLKPQAEDDRIFDVSQRLVAGLPAAMAPSDDRLLFDPGSVLPGLTRQYPVGLGLSLGRIPGMQEVRRDSRAALMQWLRHGETSFRERGSHASGRADIPLFCSAHPRSPPSSPRCDDDLRSSRDVRRYTGPP